MATNNMRIRDFSKSAPYAQNHASEATAAIGGMRMLGDAYHEHHQGKCGHREQKIMHIRQHATEYDHPTGYTHTHFAG